MSNDVPWIADRIAEAMRVHVSVPEAVRVRIEALLNGQLSDEQLTQTELTNVARELIAGMAPAPPKAGA